MVIGPIYTMVEAAKALRISRRSLQDLVRLHPCYFLNGRRKLFTERDLTSLIEAMRPLSADDLIAREKQRSRVARQSAEGSSVEARLRERLARPAKKKSTIRSSPSTPSTNAKG